MFRQEAIKQAERERRQKYRKQDEEREVIRSAIREKVDGVIFNFFFPLTSDVCLLKRTMKSYGLGLLGLIDPKIYLQQGTVKKGLIGPGSRSCCL